MSRILTILTFSLAISACGEPASNIEADDDRAHRLLMEEAERIAQEDDGDAYWDFSDAKQPTDINQSEDEQRSATTTR